MARYPSELPGPSADEFLSDYSAVQGRQPLVTRSKARAPILSDLRSACERITPSSLREAQPPAHQAATIRQLQTYIECPRNDPKGTSSVGDSSAAQSDALEALLLVEPLSEPLDEALDVPAVLDLYLSYALEAGSPVQNQVVERIRSKLKD